MHIADCARKAVRAVRGHGALRCASTSSRMWAHRVLRTCPVPTRTRWMTVKGPFTRWVHDVIESVPTDVHARSWEHLKPTNAAKWYKIVAADAVDYANECLTSHFTLHT